MHSHTYTCTHTVHTHTHKYTYILTYIYTHCMCIYGASQVVLVVKNPPANVGDIRDASLIPGSGRSPGGGHGSLL